jgi:YbbR domain-containing protein
MLRNKKFQVIISLLIGIALWFYVVGNVNPSITAKVNDIEVEMVNQDVLEELGMTATLKAPETVNIEIRGSRSAVNEAKKGEIRATVDVSNCEYGENEGEIRIELPDGISGVSVESRSVDKAVFEVE